MRSTVSSKGQVTVPLEVRKRLGLRPGTTVLFEVRENHAVLRKGHPGQHPADRLYGVLKLRRSVDALLDEVRGPRPKRS
jgi:AbrB family looped-hinge helix DNA binding protein